MEEIGSSLTVPRGVPGLSPLKFNMSEVYEAERRLGEVAIAQPGTGQQLMGYFNDVCNTTTKYISWIEYEILQAKKHFELAKATVILETSMIEFNKIKATGIKYNEDFRDAVVARDQECQVRLDVLNALIAAQTLLENKARSFVRAYNACRSICERRSGMPVPNINATPGQTIDAEGSNFMGQSDFSNRGY